VLRTGLSVGTTEPSAHVIHAYIHGTATASAYRLWQGGSVEFLGWWWQRARLVADTLHVLARADWHGSVTSHGLGSARLRSLFRGTPQVRWSGFRYGSSEVLEELLEMLEDHEAELTGAGQLEVRFTRQRVTVHCATECRALIPVRTHHSGSTTSALDAPEQHLPPTNMGRRRNTHV